jgi:hypothetical protein
MDQLLHGSEIVAGLALFVGLVVVIRLLRPPQGALQERLIVRFPGAWIIVGLPMTFLFGVSIALIAVGTGVLR